MRYWIRLSLLCRCKWTRKSHLWYGNVSEQYLLWCKNKRCCQKYQDSCACTRFLCMHRILVHAQQSFACTRIFCMHQNLDFHISDTFPIIVFAPKQLHNRDVELLSSVHAVKFTLAYFPCFQKPYIFKFSDDIHLNVYTYTQIYICCHARA